MLCEGKARGGRGCRCARGGRGSIPLIRSLFQIWQERLAAISTTTSYDDPRVKEADIILPSSWSLPGHFLVTSWQVKEADIIVEAAFERLDVKKKIRPALVECGLALEVTFEPAADEPAGDDAPLAGAGLEMIHIPAETLASPEAEL